MIDVTKFSWLGNDFAKEEIPMAYENDMLAVLKQLDKEEQGDAQRRAIADCVLSSMKQPGVWKKKNVNDVRDYIRSVMRTDAYRKQVQETYLKDKAGFMAGSLFMIMTGTIVIYFLRALYSGSYLVNFPIDTLVFSVAFAILLVNTRKKYRMIRRYTRVWEYAAMDGIAFVMCILLKFSLPPMYDLSVLVLFLAYYIEKKKFEKVVK